MIPAVIGQIFNPTEELAETPGNPTTETSTYEANADIKAQPLKEEAKTIKCLK